MARGARRFAFGLLSLGAVLVPAAGLAYLGAVSYRADRGVVAAQLEANQGAAQAVANDVDRRLRAALDAVADLFDDVDAQPVPLSAVRLLQQVHPLAQHPFRVSPDGRLRSALADPVAADTDFVALGPELIAGARSCPERGFAACVRAVRAARRRQRQLEAARRLELALCRGASTDCEPDARALTDVRRAYQSLAGADDTGPAALLGLARLDLMVADGEAARARFATLRERFEGRVDSEGIGYELIADVGAAEAAGDASALVGLYARLGEGVYRAPARAEMAIARRVEQRLDVPALEPELRLDVERIRERIDDRRQRLRAAADLALETESVLRGAADDPRGRPALRDPGKTLVYRRRPDGSVVGFAFDDRALEQVAGAVELPIDNPVATTRAVIERDGRPLQGVRTLASASFGTLLPHLNLALVNDLSRPDPLDVIVAERGRRHLLLTGGLATLLLLGLVATIRSAARERELARLKSDFVSTVSHELKTPLTSIRMFAEMLREGVSGGDQEREARYQAIIVRESERLGLLIANVLDYSQVERGVVRYERRLEEVADVVRDALETFGRLGEGEAGEVDVALEVDDPTAHFDVDRAVVVQCLLNVLSNAVKYAGRDKPIRIRVRRKGARVDISVSDSGPGIPRREQARVFREFYRAPEAYAAGVEGTGLGLALVKRHVEGLGGRVALDSSAGRGATFTLSFPAAEQPVTESERGRAA